MKQFSLFIILMGNLMIIQAQNVGIGTNTPTYPLTVIAKSAKGIIQKDGDVEVGFYTSSGSAYLQTWSDHNLQFATKNGSVQMTLQTNGNFGIGISQPTNRLHVVGSASTANNATIYAINNGSAGNGIFGISNAQNTNGVQGLSTNGTGIYGYSNSFRGVAGVTIGGTALYGNSTSGYGLEVYGKVKIAGGNTNPSAGAVLTSDASGNAVWKNQKIAFKARGIYSGFSTFPYGGGGGFQKLHFANENYDYGNNFTLLTSSTPSANSSTFLVPVNGLYHFDAFTEMNSDPFNEFYLAEIRLVFNRGGSISAISLREGEYKPAPLTREGISFGLSTDVRLQQGDIIWIEIFQDSGEAAYLFPETTRTQFSGHLVFAD